MADVITCPSGLQDRVRGMKVREERVLADRKLAKSDGQVDERGLLGGDTRHRTLTWCQKVPSSISARCSAG